MCDCVVKVSSTNQDVSEGPESRRFGALRVPLMNYLEAEDDGHCPEPMEVVAMQGKESKARKVTANVNSIPPNTENWLRKRNNYSMNNDTSTEDKHETNHIKNKCNDHRREV